MSGESRLEGRRVAVTRPREQARSLGRLIEREGGEPVLLPVIRIAPPEDWSEVDEAARRVGEYDWLVFTSANGARIWFERVATLGLEPVGSARVAAIGPGTAEALEKLGARADLVPADYVAESLLDALVSEGARGRRFLMPRASEARDVLRLGLERAGAEVTEVGLYRAVPNADGREEAERLLSAGPVDAITFTSSSTVGAFLEVVPEPLARSALERASVVCIGPVTAATARERGVRVDAVAREHTMSGLVDALAECLSAGHVREGVSG